MSMAQRVKLVLIKFVSTFITGETYKSYTLINHLSTNDRSNTLSCRRLVGAPVRIQACRVWRFGAGVMLRACDWLHWCGVAS